MTPPIPNMTPEPLDHALSPVWRAHFQEVFQKIAAVRQQIAVLKGAILELQETEAQLRTHVSIMLESVAEAEGLPKLAGVRYLLSEDGTTLHRRSA